MASASCRLNKDQFMCPICLEVFTDPVTASCGHNFCKNCITEHWDKHDVCQCPVCRTVFSTRSELRVNVFISEMAASFRKSPKHEASGSSEQQLGKADVTCDICTETKLKAVKFCLQCLASYCDTHLKPHLTAPALKKHQLTDPVKNMENMICEKHSRALELFCQEDSSLVCMLCTVIDHKTHTFVPVTEECERKRADLKKTEADVQKMIQERQIKIQEFKHSLERSDKDADREKASGAQIVNVIEKYFEKELKEINDVVEEKQRKAQKQGKRFIAELEQEIHELKRRSSELEKLSGCENGGNFLQTFSTLKEVFPQDKDWTKISIPPPIYEGTVRKGLQHGFEELAKTEGLSEEILELAEAELRKFQQYAVNITLDPHTANACLRLSDDMKKAWPKSDHKQLPNNPERFSYWGNVLGSHGYSSGRFYFEIQVKGKTEWYVGVAKESVDRKSNSPMNPENGYWMVWLKDKEYRASSSPSVRLSLESQPEKVGVFVDYEEGVVVFYNTHPAAFIYSFTGCSFTEKLYSFVNPLQYNSNNADPLIITDVTQTR